MKQLADRKPTTQFKCDYCKKITVYEKTMAYHESICYYNPNRDCPTCDNEGVEFIHGLSTDFGFIPEVDSKDCTSCLIAKQCGGKSYITNN